MPPGRRGRGAPYPFHAKVGGVGVMLTQQKSGTLDWDEEVKRLQGPEGEGTHRLAAERNDFTGGFGVMHDDGTPEARRALFYSRVYSRDTNGVLGDGDGARDDVGGGLDPRFGGLMRGPRVQMFGGLKDLTGFMPSSSDSRPVRKLVTFTPASGTYSGLAVHLAAVGPNLIGTTDPLTWTGPTAVVLKVFDSDIVDLKVYGSRKGGPELEIALDGGPRYVSYDLSGGGFSVDGTVSSVTGGDTNRYAKPQAVYFWDDSAGQFFDLTATLTDDNPDTGSGNYLNAMQTGDYLLFGFRHKFSALVWTLENENANAALMRIYHRISGTGAYVGWSTAYAPGAAVFLDNTIDPAGTTLGKSGTSDWVIDEAGKGDWITAFLTPTIQAEPLYFVRVDFDAALSNPTTLREMKVGYRLMPEAYTVAGTNLVMVQDNALITTPSGGTEGLIYDQTGPFAIPSTSGGAFSGTTGKVVGAATLAGTVMVVKTDGIYAISEAGETREIAPHMSEQPSIEDVDNDLTGNDVPVEANQGLAVWDNHLFVAHDWEVIKVSADGTGEIVGPERMTFGANTVQLRATALEGHGLHFLYAAFKGTDGKSYLGAYGVYRHVVDTDTQIESWKRMDVWALIGDLGGRTITSMRVMFDTDHQPWLVMGDEFAEVLVASLPRGFHPLAPDSGYQFSDALAEVVFPEYGGFDPTRIVSAYRSTWRVRYASGSRYIQAYFKAGHPDVGAWPALPQATVTDGDGDGFDDVSLSPVYEGYGLNVRLRFRVPVGDHGSQDADGVVGTDGPILDSFSPWFRQGILGNQRTWTFNIQAHDRVMTLQQRRIPRTVASWEALVRAWVDQRLALVTPTGETRMVKVDGVKETVARPAPQGPPQVAYSVSVSSAE